MSEICLPNNSSLRIEFGGGGDMLVKLTRQDDDLGRVVAGTFLYGSGKMGMCNNSTPEQDSLVHLFAPLARGESGLSSLPKKMSDTALRFAMPRPNDFMVVSSDNDGKITWTIEGQDFGFPSTVSVSLAEQELSNVPAQAVFNSLHRLLEMHGKVSP